MGKPRNEIVRAIYDKGHSYRFGIAPRNKWVIACLHGYLMEETAIDMNRAVFMEFVDKIEQFYLGHMKNACHTPEQQASFLKWMKRLVPEDDFRAELLEKMREKGVIK